MNNEWCISHDSDNSVVDGLRDWYSFVSAPLPEVKTNYVETQSAVVPTRDMTDADGISIYDNRQVTLTIVKRDVSTNLSADGHTDAVRWFIDEFYGKKVRVVEGSSGRFYRGRLDGAEIQRSSGNKNAVTIVCNITADPAFYDADYTVIDTKAVEKTYSGAHKKSANSDLYMYTDSGITATDATNTMFNVTADGNIFVMPGGADDYWRIRSWTKDNVVAEIYLRDIDQANDLGERLGNPSIIDWNMIWKSESDGIIIRVRRKDTTKSGKIGFSIDSLSSGDIENFGLPVLAEISNQVYPKSKFDDVVFALNNHTMAPKLSKKWIDSDRREWQSHPSLVIKSGVNHFACYAMSATGKQGDVTGNVLIRYRGGSLI